MNVKAVQEALIAKGYDLGKSGADGIWGRASIAALKAFQKKSGIEADGLYGPKTSALLLPAAVINRDILPLFVIPPWMAEGRRKKGMHETRDRVTLMAWLRSDGKTLGDPSKLPWCGDYVQTCLALTLPEEQMPANPYLAANWCKFGVDMDEKPSLGAVMVFWRDSPASSLGHVGFYESETATHYNILGGNQANGINVMSIEKKRLRKGGARWPATYPLPSTGKIAGTLGTISTNEA